MTTTIVGPDQEYWLYAWKRSILLLDNLRKRGKSYFEHREKAFPHALEYQMYYTI